MARLERWFYVACMMAMVLFVWLTRETPRSEAALLENFRDGFTQVVARVTPVVVNISAEGTVNSSPFPSPFQGTPLEPFFKQFFGPQIQQPFSSLGSGIIVRKDGYILTNAHVIENANNISITLNDGTVIKNATVVGKDPRYDLAVIKVSTNHPLPEGVFGNSNTLKVGEWALAVGTPYGFNESVTVGVISALGRNLPNQSEATYHNLIQTDASINPGNSGGPLVNIQGEIIGINTSIASPSGGSVGIGFAIPANTAKSELADLIHTGKVQHGWLGIYMQPITPDLAKAFGIDSGVLISDVVPNSPATAAGLQRGDVIMALNSQPIQQVSDLQDTVASLPVGTTTHVEIVRNGEALTLPITIGEMPNESTGSNPAPAVYWGLHLETLSPLLARQYGLNESSGILVTAVDSGSPAAQAQITPRDVILEVNQQPVKTVTEFKSIVGKSPHSTVLVLISHQTAHHYVTFEKL